LRRQIDGRSHQVWRITHGPSGFAGILVRSSRPGFAGRLRMTDVEVTPFVMVRCEPEGRASNHAPRHGVRTYQSALRMLSALEISTLPGASSKFIVFTT